VLRRLLAPQMLALHAVAVAAVVACAWLGLWQLDRTRAFNQTAVDPVPVPIAAVTQVEGSLRAGAAGRLVTLEGTYDPTQQFTVTDRGGDPWVLTVLQVGAAGAARPGVLVVRGRLAAGAVAPAPPTGPVEVTGRLQPAEPSSGAPAAGSHELAAVSPVDLLARVPYPLYDGYVVLRSQVPPASASLALVPSPAVPDTPPGYVWQHAGYVALWWAFGLFALFFWYRLVSDRLADS